MIDPRVLAIQSDPNQLRSLHEFTESLIYELNKVEGIPSKALMRELLAQSIHRTLNLSGADYKKRFLDSISWNIHKFPLQEQQSLARVHPVEISSEYRNLASFVPLEDNRQVDDDDDVVIIEPPHASVAGGSHTSRASPTPAMAPLGMGAAVSTAPSRVSAGFVSSVLEDVRRDLAFLPSTAGVAAEEVAQRLLNDEVARAVRETSAQARTAFFSDLRLNLFKLSESQQQALIEKFQELRADVVRLVESMTQEISKWLDEEKLAVHRDANSPLLTKLKALFKATLSVPFQATFKHLKGSAEKRGKETFLLKIALCLRTCLEKRFAELPELSEHVSQLRRQFFFVDGYGELMEDWLQNRIRQLNEDFTQRAAAMISRSPVAVESQLRQTFKPGCWMTLNDVRLEEALFKLFLDESFPKHVVTLDSVRTVLRKVFAIGAGELHMYGEIARLPPARPNYTGSPPQDAVESELLEVLQRLPAFPALRRIRPGHYWFGRIEVEFSQTRLDGTGLLSRGRRNGQPLREMPAEDFFRSFGAEEFPSAAAMAVQASLQDPNGPPSTSIEENNMTVDLDDDGPAPVQPLPFQPELPVGPPLPLPTLLAPAPLQAPAIAVQGQRLSFQVSGTMPMGGGPSFPSLPARIPPPVVQSARFEPYPAVQRFGLDDDEI